MHNDTPGAPGQTERRPQAVKEVLAEPMTFPELTGGVPTT